MTKAQQVYERVEALVATGEVRKADAFRQVAEEYGQPFDSIRGAYYSHTRSTSGTPSRPRRRQTTTADAIESATTALTRAVDAIDVEVAHAKERAEQAQADYKHLRDTADERKKTIQAKIDALNA
jgi:hypothetical protein